MLVGIRSSLVVLEQISNYPEMFDYDNGLEMRLVLLNLYAKNLRYIIIFLKNNFKYRYNLVKSYYKTIYLQYRLHIKINALQRLIKILEIKYNLYRF